MSCEQQSEINLFLGRVSQHEARLYAEVSSLPGGGEWTLRGQVRGPHHKFGRTLPATFAFHDAGTGHCLLAEAVVTEPCFWSSKLPALYEVQLQLCYRGRVYEQVIRSVGIRFLGSSAENLILEGNRWVLRGVHESSVRQAACGQWREHTATMVVDDPSDELCRSASDLGVWIVARLVDASEAARSLRRLRNWAAVAAVILPAQAPAAPLRRLARNVLLAQPCAEDGQAAAGADLVVADVSEPAAFANLHRGCPLPIIAVRRLNSVVALAQARAACDHLQRDLAPYGDYAGYVV